MSLILQHVIPWTESSPESLVCWMPCESNSHLAAKGMSMSLTWHAALLLGATTKTRTV